MALTSSTYRVHLDITYSSAGNATSAASAINSSLAGIGRSETCTVAGAQVTLIISGIDTEAEAITIRDNIRSAWSGQPRTGGKAAVMRSSA